MGHRSGAALFHRQPGLGAVERLDLALFVDAEDDCVRRRIDIEADHVAQLADEFGVLGKLELANAMGLQPMGGQMPVQCVVSPDGVAKVKAMTRSAIEGSSLERREGRVVSRRRPSKPSSGKRS
jgi:hypothetical protein